MMPIKLAIISLLLLLFIQDLKSRSVSWILFPALAALMFYERSSGFRNLDRLLIETSFNWGLLLIQLILINSYFSLRQRKLINITDGLLGWGDILFLVILGIYLPVMFFILFYTISILLILICWSAAKVMSIRLSDKIPLAGLQALLLGATIFFQDWFPVINPNSLVWEQYPLFQ